MPGHPRPWGGRVGCPIWADEREFGAWTALVTAADGAASPDPNLLNNLAAATVKVTR
jgi:hypothetical protein